MTIEAVKDFPSADESPGAYAQERRDLACAFRWATRWGFNEGIANHFSLAVSNDGSQRNSLVSVRLVAPTGAGDTLQDRSRVTCTPTPAPSRIATRTTIRTERPR